MNLNLNLLYFENLHNHLENFYNKVRTASHMSCCGRLEAQSFKLIFKSCFQKADITISGHVELLKYHFTTNLNCFKQT